MTAHTDLRWPDGRRIVTAASDDEGLRKVRAVCPVCGGPLWLTHCSHGACRHAPLFEEQPESPENREDGETCPDCGEAVFDGRCRCAEIDAKIYDAMERGEP